MAYQRHIKLTTKLILLFIYAYISLMNVGCIRVYIGGRKDMPFQTLSRDEFLKTEIINVSSYGAIGDGIRSDSLAISQAISDANDNELLLPSGTYRIDNDITIPSNVSIRLNNGAKLSIDEGVSVTIYGTLVAGLYQIFDGNGIVSIAKGACEHLLPQWWGAVGDGINDDTNAIQKALNAANGKIRIVYLLTGKYKITSRLEIKHATCLQGSGVGTEIYATGGISAIKVSVDVTNYIYEGSRLSDFRLMSDTTPTTGVGIEVYGDRACIIERVWIGCWYGSLYGNQWGYGFEKGMDVNTNPAYYVTIRDCQLFRNTYGIYLNYGANHTRITGNQIWYGDYGVYCVGPGAVIENNSIEGFGITGIYVDANTPIIKNNWIESAGKKSVTLGSNAFRATITGNLSTTGISNQDDVINNSGNEYHRINDNRYPVGVHHMSGSPAGDDSAGLAGLLHCDYKIGGYWAKDMILEATLNNLEIKARKPDKFIEFGSAVESNVARFNTPIGGSGYNIQNHLTNAESIHNWAKGSGITLTANACIAPNGDTTATKAISTVYTDWMYEQLSSWANTGNVITFSVWARADVRTCARIGIASTNTPVAVNFIEVDTEWRRYSVSFIADANYTFTRGVIYPSDTGYEGRPIYLWGAQITKNTSTITGTDNSGVDNKTTKVVDTTKNFKASGIDIGGLVTVLSGGSGTAKGRIAGINSIIEFNAGNVAEPSVGDIITGGASGSTGEVVEVVINSGSFAGGDAVGYIEYSPKTLSFTTEGIAWSGGSANIIATKPDSVLVTSLSVSYGTKGNCDNGDIYYVASSFKSNPPPYIKSQTTAVNGMSSSNISTGALTSSGNIKCSGTQMVGFTGVTTKWDPMTSNVSSSGDVVIVNPNAAGRVIVEWNGHQNGDCQRITNISSAYSVTLNGMSLTLPPLHTLIRSRSGGVWSIIYFGYNDLSNTSSPSFKRINGAVYALTNESIIDCDMNNGNVFTLSTTTAIGNVQINASNGVAGQRATFIITDDATGGHVVTFETNFKSSGALTGTANKTATIDFIYNGTSWYETNRITGL